MPKRLIWELAVLGSGLFYLVMALCENIESRYFVFVFVVLATQVLVHGRHEGRKH